MDSHMINYLWKPDVKLFIDYGTKQTAEERKRLPKDVIVKEIDLSQYIENDGINTIPLRNLLFANIAINYGDIVAIGGVRDDLHYDKSKRFARRTTRLFNSVLGKEKSKRKVKIVVPYRDYTKRELMQLYIARGGSVEKLKNESWSCHFPENGKECGKCIPCSKKQNIIREVQQGYDKQYPIYFPY